MQLNRGAVGGGHGCGAPDWTQLRCRERELVAQLHELLFPSTAPPPSGASVGGASSAALSVEHCGSPVTPQASCDGGGKRRGRGRKRVREDERRLQEEQTQRGGRSTATKATTRGSRRRKEGTTTTTIVTTVPDFDGYQWKKYGQKHIESAQHPRSYYRCTNSADQACPAKRTVQRNDGGNGDDGASPKYTVVYISEHSCKTTEAVSAPVILETTVLTKTPDIAAVFASSSGASSGTQSPASSDITWSGGTIVGASATPGEHGEYCSSLFAVDGDCWEWDPSPMAPAAATALLQEMDFAGPIMSPVHVAATDGSWISDLFVHESPFILNSCELFGF